MFLQQNLDVWNGVGIGAVSSVQWSEAALFWAIFISSLSPLLAPVHALNSQICLQAFPERANLCCSINHNHYLISNKIALFNNSSSRFYPFIYQHADHIFNIILHVLDDPFQSGSHPPFLRSVRRATSASLLNVNVTRTTQRISGTTWSPARTTSSRHARRASARAHNTPRASSGPGARGSHVARVTWRRHVTMSPRGWTATCPAPSTVNCQKLKVIISRVSPVAGQLGALTGWLHDCMTSHNSNILDRAPIHPRLL